MSADLGSFADIGSFGDITINPLELGSIVTDFGTEFMSFTDSTSFQVPSIDVPSLGGFDVAGSFAGDASWFDTFNSGSILDKIPSVSDFSLPSLPSLPSLADVKSVATTVQGYATTAQGAIATYQKVAPTVNTAASALGIQNPLNNLINPISLAAGAAGSAAGFTAKGADTAPSLISKASSFFTSDPNASTAADATTKLPITAPRQVDEFGLNILTDAETAAMEQKLTLVNSLVPASSGPTNYNNAVATRDALLPLTKQFENEVNSATAEIAQTTDTIARAQEQLLDPTITDAERAVVEANIKDAYDAQAVAQDALTAAKTNLDATSAEFAKALTVIESTDVSTVNAAAAVAAAATPIPAVNTQNAQAPGITQAQTDQLRAQQALRTLRKVDSATDWRVKLRLAKGSTYLYNEKEPGILAPLAANGGTDGVIFPYTPSIETAYKANYTPYDLTHSNYRGYFYQNSYVDSVNLRCTFTAQDNNEANYLLAVIHFFRSATKMFYGQDAQRGSPPPLVYLSGLGDFQFKEHPCVISQFNYTLPPDVDYIRAGSPLSNNTNLLNNRTRTSISSNPLSFAVGRLLNNALTKGAEGGPQSTKNLPVGVTYVPTKMEIALSLLPMQSRQQVSTQFSVKKFGQGNLLNGGFW